MNTSGTGQKQLPIVYNCRELTSEEIDLVDGGCLPEWIFHLIGQTVSTVYGGAAAYKYGQSVASGVCAG